MRMMRHGLAVATTAAFVLLGVFATPAAAAPTPQPTVMELSSRPATAAEAAALDLRVAAGQGCQGNEVSNNSYVHVCFERDGDVIWVHDDQADGERAVGHLVVRSGHYFCHNAAGAGVRWEGCSFSSQTAETETVLYFGTTRNGQYGQDNNETSWEYEPAS